MGYANKQDLVAHGKTYYQRHKKRIRRKQKLYYAKNKKRLIAKAHVYHRQRNYGITQNAYREMLKNQNGRCFLCKSKSPGTGYKNFCVDHDHKTGKVRKLLCRSCNLGLGNLQDDPKLLRKAAEYLENTWLTSL
jgi:hypothetical protein